MLKKTLFFLLSPWVVTNYGGKSICLTFDDGPDPIYTRRILNILKENNIKAEFYMIGGNILNNIELVRQVVDAGHVVGNHSYDHNKFKNLSFKKMIAQIRSTYNILYKEFGIKEKKFRPPQGTLNIKVLFAAIVCKHKIILWDYDTLDYTKNYDLVKENLLTEAKISHGSIILMHDDNEVTVEFLPILIEFIKKTKLEIASI